MTKPFRWVPVIAYCALIFYLLSMNMPSGPESTWVDKFYHILLFTPLSYLLMYAFDGFVSFSWSKKLAIVVVIAAGYGALMEVYQFFTPARSPEVLDALMNLIGCLLGTFSFLLVKAYHGMMAKRCCHS